MIVLSPDNSKTNRDSLLIFVFGVFIFTIGLSPEFIGFQSRFALFAQEMLHYGPTFFPTTYEIPYPDYPATSTYLIYLFSLPFGRVTVLSAVLPTAITSALILVFIYYIGAIHSRAWAILSVLFALFTHEYLSESRSIALDQYTSLATVLCFYLAYSASVFGKQKRLWFIPLLFIMGFCFRGPIGLVIPAAVTCGFYLCQRELKKFLVFGLASLILLGLCTAGLLAAAYHQGGDHLLEKVIQMQGAGRVSQYTNNYFYYVITGFTAYAVSFPLAVVVVSSRFKCLFNREDEDYKFLGYLALWIALILLGLSIPGTKKSRYLLPMVPAVSLLASYMFVQADPQSFLAAGRRIFLWGCHKLPFVAVVGAAAMFIPNKYFTSIPLWPGLVGLALLISLLAVNLRINPKVGEDAQNKLVIIAVAVLSFVVFNIWIIGPLMFNHERTGLFVKKVESLLQSQPGKTVFYRMGPNAEDVKFMVNINRPIKPTFLNNEEGLLQQVPTTYLISRQKVFERLPAGISRKMQVQFWGKIGHTDCVVFSPEEKQVVNKVD